MTTCYSCTKGFSLLNSEKSCDECRLSFCKGCLPGNIHLDRLGRDGKVCSRCFKKLTNKIRDRSPPSALIRRLDLMKTPHSSTTIIYKDSPSDTKMAKLRRGLSLEDQQIVNRLQRLHEERVSLKKRRCSQPVEQQPCDDEIAQRLAKLRGQEGTQSSSKASSTPVQEPDKRTDVEKEEGLIQEAKDRIRLEANKPDPDAEIASRLAKLRGENAQKNDKEENEVKEFIKTSGDEEMEIDSSDVTATDIQEMAKKLSKEAQDGLKDLSEDPEISKKMNDMALDPQVDDTESDDVIRQILDEAALEKKLGHLGPLPAFEDDDDLEEGKTAILRSTQFAGRSVQKQLNTGEEFPWCVICNEDASLRCPQCESDLYCSRCFRECHNELMDEVHQPQKFASKAN
uniref:Zinc finger FYVE domain-containing protein 19 n=1 Tax=Caligus rogercresseyi TaxID=217165 RepID=C1BQV7_CALRO|nr:Zinc finger FYVE domain-containing protein 19 [Caligus rogercresseyi]